MAARAAPVTRLMEGVMQQLLVGLAVLACPIGMAVMMWLMMRGKDTDEDANGKELRQLRKEIDALKAESVDRHRAPQL